MSVHINIRIPDEQAAAIDALGKSRSQAIIEALGAYLKQPTVIVAPPMSPEVVADLNNVMNAKPLGKITAIGGDHPMCGMLPHGHMRVSVGSPPKNLKLARETKPKRALGRTPENLSLADNRDSYARPAHAPGCKCLMCQGK
jgi:hypothetical protein